jgi:hypothetical protein
VAKPLARLRHTQATKVKISDAKKGRPRSAETKAKISAARTGQKHSPETIAKITAKRRALAAMTDEEKAELAIQKLRAEQAKVTDARVNRWKLDLMACSRIGNAQLYLDVKQSGGWRSKRVMRKADPRVSEGWCHKQGKVLWPTQEKAVEDGIA